MVTTLSRKGSRAYSAVPRVIFSAPLSSIIRVSTQLMTSLLDTAAETDPARTPAVRPGRTGETYRADAQTRPATLDMAAWAAATLVGSYLPHESEFDPSLLAQDARDRGADIVCPRVNGKSMSFHYWQADDEAESTIGGVKQPLPAAPIVDTAAIDLFLTPLLGCGESGMRLGYGGGLYDRLFAQVGGLRLGVGFALQRVSDWASEAHDQRLDGFLSEEGLTLFD